MRSFSTTIILLSLIHLVSANHGGFWPIRNPTHNFRKTSLPKSHPFSPPSDKDATTIRWSEELRGGARYDNNPYQNFLSVGVDGFTKAIQIILPPTVYTIRAVVGFYRLLPRDAIIAQFGLVYCFCGGYFPTLFAALEAARHCGLERAATALSDLTDEAASAINAARTHVDFSSLSYSEAMLRTTSIVMKSIDPIRINKACSALYTTWLGVSTVLSQEFAKTISLSVTLGACMEPFVAKVVSPPVYFCVPKEYHRWVPIALGWITKAIVMRIAWRVQRVLTAGTSAVIGGLMFARAISRMLNKQGITFGGLIDGDNEDTTIFDETFGLAVGVWGLTTQLGDGKFDPRVKFPFTLLTWPFEIAETWIQWQITPRMHEDAALSAKPL